MKRPLANFCDYIISFALVVHDVGIREHHVDDFLFKLHWLLIHSRITFKILAHYVSMLSGLHSQCISLACITSMCLLIRCVHLSKACWKLVDKTKSRQDGVDLLRRRHKSETHYHPMLRNSDSATTFRSHLKTDPFLAVTSNMNDPDFGVVTHTFNYL